MSKYGLFDIIGPVMVGPSSSHTAGAAKLGYLAAKFIEPPLTKITFYLHGSFSYTASGHGTDKALLAGAMGILPDDPSLPLAFEIANNRGIEYSFIAIDLGDVHPNTVKIVIENEMEKAEIVGSSIGGGLVKIFLVNGIEVNISGEGPTLITMHYDRTGVLSKVVNVLADAGYNIASLQLFRKERFGQAIMVINIDEKVDHEIVEKISQMAFIDKAFLVNMEN